MITVSNISLSFGTRFLFKDVNLKFSQGNCYGVIGANGSGKSTFLKILSGELKSTSGEISKSPHDRMAVLKQDHFEFDDYEVLETVIRGHQELYSIMIEKEKLYAKEDFNDQDGEKLGDLEAEFAELNGWEAESEAAILLTGLGISTETHHKKMRDLSGAEKVKVLLTQTLFGKPDILLMDEPTNHLDVAAITWLEEFLYNFENTVIVVSHDRHFLNRVCTHIVDIDFSKIQLFVGNYDFWYESSQLALRLTREQNKKSEVKRKELTTFIQRFSANASKARQATSRQKLLEKLTLDDIKPSSRKYPFVIFKPEREIGNNVLKVENLSKKIEGKLVLKNVSFTINKGDKVAFVGLNDLAKSCLFKIISGELQPDSGEYTWGITTSKSYFPKDNSSFFQDENLNLVDWMRQFSKDQTETYVRGFLGKMLFSGDETQKKVKVLSGGEKVRCMLSRMMLSNANVLILNEPSNHLDLESITALNNALINFPGNILFSSQDHQFTQTIASRIINMNFDTLYDKEQSYDEYLESILALKMN